jgi:hypothetical protein
MGRYLELAKKTLGVLAQSDTVPRKSKPDLYGARVRAALSKFNSPDYPAGMVAWLDGAHPELHEKLISLIPNEVERLWNESAPLGQFQAALDRWVAIHREGCRLYRVALDAQNGVIERT